MSIRSLFKIEICQNLKTEIFPYYKDVHTTDSKTFRYINLYSNLFNIMDMIVRSFSFIPLQLVQIIPL